MTTTEAEIEFARAKANGWIPMFTAAGSVYGYTPQLLMAIASRETNMENIRGDFHSDGPHGFGLMQIDIGSCRDFCVSGQWENVEASIRMGALVLHSKQVQLEHGQGMRVTTVGHKADTFLSATPPTCELSTKSLTSLTTSPSPKLKSIVGSRESQPTYCPVPAALLTSYHGCVATTPSVSLPRPPLRYEPDKPSVAHSLAGAIRLRPNS
jgi:hypothetical protein